MLIKAEKGSCVIVFKERKEENSNQSSQLLFMLHKLILNKHNAKWQKTQIPPRAA